MIRKHTNEVWSQRIVLVWGVLQAEYTENIVTLFKKSATSRVSDEGLFFFNTIKSRKKKCLHLFSYFKMSARTSVIKIFLCYRWSSWLQGLHDFLMESVWWNSKTVMFHKSSSSVRGDFGWSLSFYHKAVKLSHKFSVNLWLYLINQGC